MADLPSNDDGEDFLTIRETSQILGVSLSTLRRWDKEEHLKAVQLYPRSPRRYRRADVDALLEQSA